MTDDPSAATHPTANPARDNLEASKSHALQAAEELRAAAAAKASQLRAAAEEHAFRFRDIAEEKAHHFRDIAEEKAHHLREVAEEKAGHVRDAAGEGWEEARIKAKDLHVETEKFVRANPTKAVLSALGIGFVLGLIFRR